MDVGLLPHRRLNPLTGEYVLVSPQRTQRPWQGAQETMQQETRSVHDPNCYLCPGNTRANGEVNPAYTDTFVFTNDFSALIPCHSYGCEDNRENLFQRELVSGECRVICFSPRHDLTLAQMTVAEIQKVIAVWVQQYQELAAKYSWVQIFENKGAIMGCSNPHPHGQVWASSFIPNEVQKEDMHQRQYFLEQQQPLLYAYTQQEMCHKDRVVCDNKDWLVVVPYWAIWPFETLLLPKFKIASFLELQEDQRYSLAEILKDLLTRYDALFACSFPYSMGWHGTNAQHWQLHAHFYPPLLRSATVKKFMVGYELLAEVQRDLTPEQAAKCLRDIQ